MPVYASRRRQYLKVKVGMCGSTDTLPAVVVTKDLSHSIFDVGHCAEILISTSFSLDGITNNAQSLLAH